jgi:hypothetical protein
MKWKGIHSTSNKSSTAVKITSNPEKIAFTALQHTVLAPVEFCPPVPVEN